MPRPPVCRFTPPAPGRARHALMTARSAAAACVLAALLPALAPAAATASPAATVGQAATASQATMVGQPTTAGLVTARRRAPTAYVANLLSGTISRIALAGGRAERPVSLGRRSGPWAIAVAPGGRTLWVASAGNGTVTPVSTRTGRAGRAIRVPRLPEELAVAPDGKTVWVVSQLSGNNQTPGRITPISTATRRAGRPIRVGITPGPLVISPDSRTVYLATSGMNDQTLAGNLTVISARTGRVRRVLKGLYPADMALGRGGRTLWVASAGSRNAVIPVATATLRRGRPVPLPDFPQQLIMGPGGGSVYVLGDSGRVTRISARTGRVVWSVRSTAPAPDAIGVTPDGRELYVLAAATRRRRGHLIPVSTASGTPGRRIRVGRDPLAIAFGPSGRTAYVLCSPTWTKGDTLEFGVGSVFPVTVATGRVGRPVLTGRGSLSLAVVPGRTYEPWAAGPLK